MILLLVTSTKLLMNSLSSMVVMLRLPYVRLLLFFLVTIKKLWELDLCSLARSSK
jgi:hypothetical protein